MKIALVVPHIFMQDKILPKVIFSPGYLAINLAIALAELGHEVSFFSPGPVDFSKLWGRSKLAASSAVSASTPKITSLAKIKNFTADLSLFEQELAGRGDDYLDLLKKHPLTFITLARQVQSELVAKAYQLANQNHFDLVHVWCNEEELALVMAKFCQKPVVFTHHEPFNFLVKYKSMFAKYADLNWVSLSYKQQDSLNSLLDEENLRSDVNLQRVAKLLRHDQAQTQFQPQLQKNQQQKSQPATANFVANIYHGLPLDAYTFQAHPASGKKAYFLYLGRIIEPKGVHLAIQAAQQAGVNLKIAGKHYSGFAKDAYWERQIKPQIDGQQIEYVGFVKDQQEKQKLLASATALIMPSTWEEPFGLVMIEALACGTPIIGFKQGAVPEIVKDGENGCLVNYSAGSEKQSVENLVEALSKVKEIKRQKCRQSFEQNFSLKKMAKEYERVYNSLM